MEALPPSVPNAGLPQPVPAGQAGLAILLAEVTQALARLPAGTSLTALVTRILPQTGGPDPSAAKPATGTLVEVGTPDGPARISIPVQIPIAPGARLDIAVSRAEPQPQWRLLAVDDRPATPAGLAAAAPASAQTPALPAPQLSVQTPIAANAPATGETAPRTAPAPGIAATLVTSSDRALPSGTTLVVRIISLTPPLPPPAAPLDTEEATSASPPTPGSGPSPVQTSVTAPAPPQAAPPQTAADTAPAAPIETLLASTPAAAQAPPAAAAAAQAPTATAPPTASDSGPPPPAATAAAAPAPSSPPHAAEISGQVLDNRDGGKPLVRTPLGLIALDTAPQSLPPDSTVTLHLIGKPLLPPVFAAAPPPTDQPDRVLPEHLTRLIETAQNNPGGDMLAGAVREKIPAPGPKLAAQLLSVIATAAAPQGLARFFGDGLVAALAHAAPQALLSLARHWESASTPVQGPGDGDWRAVLIPLMMGGAITNLRLTIRQRQGKLAAAEREKGTRFLLDLDLSRLGPMQFDGLVKRQHKRFDLIIRTKTPLPGDMRRDIDALFLNGLLDFDLAGSVVFHPDGRFVTTPRLTDGASGIIFA